MSFCPFCNDDRAERVVMRGMSPTRTCDRGHVLTDAVQIVDAPKASQPCLVPQPQPVAPVNLAKMIHARKRELRKTIREASRELAQLERLGASKTRRPATVTPIKRGASQ